MRNGQVPAHRRVGERFGGLLELALLLQSARASEDILLIRGKMLAFAALLSCPATDISATAATDAANKKLKAISRIVKCSCFMLITE